MSVNMKVTCTIRTTLLSLAALPLLFAGSVRAQDSTSHHGRKYKPPPATSHIEVVVTKKFNGKPIMNAAVVFNPTSKDGKDLGSLEVKTDPDGKAAIDIIPTGSIVSVQVIADGFATYAEDFTIDEASRSIPVALLRPQEQSSSYVDNDGKASSRKAGVQEPNHPTTDTSTSSASQSTSSGSQSTTPPASSGSSSSSSSSTNSSQPAQSAPKQ
jgi:hypothetical protein